MKKEEKLIEVMQDIYVELFAKSTPAADFNQLVEQAVPDENGMKDIGFMNYEISQEVSDEILDRHCKKLPKSDRHVVKMAVILGCSPKYSN